MNINDLKSIDDTIKRLQTYSASKDMEINQLK